MDFSCITRLVTIVVSGSVRSETVCSIEAYSVLYGVIDVDYYYLNDPDVRNFSIHPAYEL